MANDFSYTLLKRALGGKRSDRCIKTLYGHKSWVDDLDIVNELGGHNGCVNALSWSSSGSLLASGSDDTFINIWSYNPTNVAKPFTLNTSVSSGHRSNIFSVKFMPHSDDRTVISCAGDSQVRVFDLEYGGLSRGSTGLDYSSSTASRRFQDFFPQARWLSDANTNARVYRCHSDRAKRIVTESSPFLFLTCSEDGEVRQWDLRLPSSAYPPPRRAGRIFGHLVQTNEEGCDSLPPPLISYKEYDIDLNSISCAASRPHYIALGGSHLHCFLHDRRMLGRDLACEAGQPGYNRAPVAGTPEDEAMSSATRCVKRFAPNARRRMNDHESGHITACKISDANPNEMVASWSGDHVYSFDLIKSPDARDADARHDEAFRTTHRAKNRTDRKRKRKHAAAAGGGGGGAAAAAAAAAATAAAAANSSSSIAENPAPSRRLRRVSDSIQEAGQTAVQVREDDTTGEVEEETTNTDVSSSRLVADVLLSEAQVTAERIARGIVRLRKTLFDFSAALREESAQDMAVLMENSAHLTPHTARFTDLLGQCASLLPQLDEIMRAWSYPVAPTAEEVSVQNTLRRNRQSTWRFVQASGCLSYVLGGQLQTSGQGSDARLDSFSQIRPAVHEGKTIWRSSRFCYDFLKAILCWIDGGAPAVLRAFTRPPSISADSPRFPLSESDTVDSFVPKLHQYLYELADESKPVINIDTNRFEHDERRQVFESQKSAVQAFTRALSGIELRTGQGLSSIDMSTTTTSTPDTATTTTTTATTTKRIMDKGAATRFWVVTVGRSLLMEAAEGVTFDFVNRAFGGLMFELLPSSERQQARRLSQTSQTSAAARLENDGEAWNEEEANDEDDDDDDGYGDGGGDDDLVHDDYGYDDYGYDDDDDDDDDPSMLRRRNAWSSRGHLRAMVNMDVPYSSHSRTYKGHCNTRTVKDVNYYGLDDEYVVSGSDDGMFFIWDRKSCKIVNILVGDGEVVNVVQGHPYEPMIACSGIDSTIKIFGPGGMSRERRNAAQGIDIANPSGGSHPSLRFGQRRRMQRAGRVNNRNNEDEDEDGNDGDDDDNDDNDNDGNKSNRDQHTTRYQAEDDEDEAGEPKVNHRRNGLSSRKALDRMYEITSQNDVERRRASGVFVTVSDLDELLLRAWVMAGARLV